MVDLIYWTYVDGQYSGSPLVVQVDLCGRSELLGRKTFTLGLFQFISLLG